MSSFKLEIITPERMFFSGEVEQISCKTVGGELGILKGHQPMIAVLDEHNLKIKMGGRWCEFHITDGFVEVRPDEVVIFGEYCDPMEVAAEQNARRMALVEEERRRHEERISQQKQDTISITRALSSRKIKNEKNL